MNEWTDESFDNSFLIENAREREKNAPNKTKPENFDFSFFYLLLCWCRWHSDLISIVVIFFRFYPHSISLWIFHPSWMILVPTSIENELCVNKNWHKIITSMFEAKKGQRRQCWQAKKCTVCSTYSMWSMEFYWFFPSLVLDVALWNGGPFFLCVNMRTNQPTNTHYYCYYFWYLRCILNGKCVCVSEQNEKPCVCPCDVTLQAICLLLFTQSVSPFSMFLHHFFSLSLSRSSRAGLPFFHSPPEHRTHMRARNASHIYCVDKHLWIV